LVNAVHKTSFKFAMLVNAVHKTSFKPLLKFK